MGEGNGLSVVAFRCTRGGMVVEYGGRDDGGMAGVWAHILYCEEAVAWCKMDWLIGLVIGRRIMRMNKIDILDKKT